MKLRPRIQGKVKPKARGVPRLDDEPFPFMKLPPELRLLVYHHHFLDIKLEFTHDLSSCKLPLPAILGVSHHIRNEALPQLYESGIVKVLVNHRGIRIGKSFLKERRADEEHPEKRAVIAVDPEEALRRARRLEINVAGIARIGWRQRWQEVRGDPDGGHMDDEDILQFVNDRANEPYDCKQNAHTLANRLLSAVHLRSITLLLTSFFCDDEDAVWIAAPLANLRNKMGIPVYCGKTARMGEDQDLREIADGTFITSTEPPAWEEELSALRSFLMEFNRYKQGAWVKDAFGELDKARVASHANDRIEFDRRRGNIFQLWEDEVDARRREEACIAQQFQDLKARAKA